MMTQQLKRNKRSGNSRPCPLPNKARKQQSKKQTKNDDHDRDNGTIRRVLACCQRWHRPHHIGWARNVPGRCSDGAGMRNTTLPLPFLALPPRFLGFASPVSCIPTVAPWGKTCGGGNPSVSQRAKPTGLPIYRFEHSLRPATAASGWQSYRPFEPKQLQ